MRVPTGVWINVHMPGLLPCLAIKLRDAIGREGIVMMAAVMSGVC